MEKRRHSVSISVLLLRFVFLLLGSMLLCGAAALGLISCLERCNIVYPGHISNRQAEEMLSEKPEHFVSPGENFLASYALFDKDGSVLESNAEGKTLQALQTVFREKTEHVEVMRYVYGDGSEIVIRWHYRKEFVNPALRKLLPPFETLWWIGLLTAWVLCLLLHTFWLRRRLAEKLELFSQVSEKVAARELDFTVPYAGIKEYDKALAAMEHMRKALYEALSAQWAAAQEREAEIAALAHDLKTPLTLIGGNAELLLEEDLSPENRKMAETIVAGSRRARQYVAGFLEISAGEDEPFEQVSLRELFGELGERMFPVAEAEGVCLQIQGQSEGILEISAGEDEPFEQVSLRELFGELGERMFPVAEAEGVCLQIQGQSEGTVRVQKERLLRALGNIVQNGAEHTPEGGTVWLQGSIRAGIWEIAVRDEGRGFDSEAVKYASRRLWRGDGAREANGHNGLGLWFAAGVIKAHGGTLELDNYEGGGMVIVRLPAAGCPDNTEKAEMSRNHLI